MSRKDVHRPSMMNPADYRVLAVGEVDVEENPETGMPVYFLVLIEEDPRWSELGEPDESTWEGHRQNQCDHCGARIKFFSVVEHIPTGEILTVGLQCTGRFFNRDWNYCRELLKTKAIRDRRVRKWLEANPDLAIALQFCQSEAASHIARDVASKLREFGLSEKQTTLIRKEYEGYKQRQEAAQEAPETTCPTGRVTITGTVVSVKEIEDTFTPNYGGRAFYIYKMLVKDDRGFKVYGTLPGCFGRAIQGYRVSFSAQVEPSTKDPFFGTYKRPTKAECLGKLMSEVAA